MATQIAGHKTSPVIVLTGGGTGGHITPILAVAHELKQLRPRCVTVYIGEKGSKFAELTAEHPAIDYVQVVSAGKFRRYHNEAWWRRLTDIKTIVLNIRDCFRVMVGAWQAWRLLGRLEPDVVFLKGGFVGVPTGMAAALRGIPLVTHDSDIVPGLANRLVSRWVQTHATALPPEEYSYPIHKVQQVGVLVEHSFQSVSPSLKAKYKKQLDLPAAAPVLLITGASSGAVTINQAVTKIIDQLLEKSPELHVIHQAGKGKQGVYGEYKHERLRVREFLRPMAAYMGAADLVVSRASANTLAELGVQGKATVVIPSPHLTGGHQLENAARLKEQGAAVVLQESELYDLQHGLLATLLDLLAHPAKREKLAETLQKQTVADAAHRLAMLLLDCAKPK